MTKDEKLTLCSGCRDDYYNRPGNSLPGECFLLKSARKVERTRVGVWQNPPYQWRPQETLHCHKPDGEVWIEKDDPRVVVAEREQE